MIIHYNFIVKMSRKTNLESAEINRTIDTIKVLYEMFELILIVLTDSLLCSLLNLNESTQ